MEARSLWRHSRFAKHPVEKLKGEKAEEKKA